MPRPAPRLPSLATTHRPFRPGTTHAFRRAAASSRPNPTTPVRGHEGLGAPESAPRSRRLVGRNIGLVPTRNRAAISLVPPEVAPTILAAGGLRRKGSASRAFDPGSSGSRLPCTASGELCRQRGPATVASSPTHRTARAAPVVVRPARQDPPRRQAGRSDGARHTCHGSARPSDPPRRHGRTYRRPARHGPAMPIRSTAPSWPDVSTASAAPVIVRRAPGPPAVIVRRTVCARRVPSCSAGPVASTGPSPSDVATAHGVPVTHAPPRPPGPLGRNAGRTDGARHTCHGAARPVRSTAPSRPEVSTMHATRHGPPAASGPLLGAIARTYRRRARAPVMVRRARQLHWAVVVGRTVWCAPRPSGAVPPRRPAWPASVAPGVRPTPATRVSRAVDTPRSVAASSSATWRHASASRTWPESVSRGAALLAAAGASGITRSSALSGPRPRNAMLSARTASSSRTFPGQPCAARRSSAGSVRPAIASP